MRKSDVTSTLVQSQAIFDTQPPGPEKELYLPAWTREVLAAVSTFPPRAKLVAELMINTGARVSEILELKTSQISMTGHLVIHAKKGSAVRVAYAPEAHPLALLAASKGWPLLFQNYSYKMFVHDLLASAPNLFPRFRTKRVLTNIFRRTAAEIAQAFTEGDTLTAQRFLGHISPKSTNFYLQNFRSQ